jgi:hypothetical protein
MPISISGSGVITGASSFASNTIFGGTVGVAGAVNTSSSLTTASGGLAKSSFPSGLVIQVKSFNFLSTSYTSSSTSTSFVDSGLFVTFDNNLRDSNSKVLAFFDVYFGQTDAAGAWAALTIGTIYEGGVNRGDSTFGLSGGNANLGGGGANMQYDASSLNGSCLFTPSTTTTPTVRFYYRSQNVNITSYINRLGNSGYPAASTMTIMEIAG